MIRILTANIKICMIVVVVSKTVQHILIRVIFQLKYQYIDISKMTYVCIKILYRDSQEVGVCSPFHEAELISTDAKHRGVVINVLYCDDNKSDGSVWVSKCPSAI